MVCFCTTPLTAVHDIHEELFYIYTSIRQTPPTQVVQHNSVLCIQLKRIKSRGHRLSVILKGRVGGKWVAMLSYLRPIRGYCPL